MRFKTCFNVALHCLSDFNTEFDVDTTKQISGERRIIYHDES